MNLTENTISQDDIIHLVKWLLDEPQLTQGERVKEFETAFAKKIDSKHAVFVNSGSSANLLMLYALKLRFGEKLSQDPSYKIVIPALSWATDLAPAIQLGLEPILVDCNWDDLSVGLYSLETIFKKERPEALLLVSILGLVPNMDAVLDLCAKYNVVLLEDACESLGSQYENQYLGSFGLMSSFSFYFSHHISTIEGGMITTDDEIMYHLLLMLRSHGWGRDLPTDVRKKLQKDTGVDDLTEKFTFYVPGFNVRATDLQAVIGLKQLDEIDNIARIRHNNYLEYRELLSDELWIPRHNMKNKVSNFGMPIISKKRNQIVQGLEKNGIQCRPLVCGSLGKQPMWKRYNGSNSNFDLADQANKNGIYVPNHSKITLNDVYYIWDVINEEL